MAENMLVMAVGRARCAVPLVHVVEIMRPLPIVPIASSDFVLGVAVIRGIPTPVVDAARLLGHDAAAPTRFVTLRTAERTVALAVQGVEGVRAVAADVLHALPPLLADAEAGVVERIATRDAELLAVLETSRLASDAIP